MVTEASCWSHEEHPSLLVPMQARIFRGCLESLWVFLELRAFLHLLAFLLINPLLSLDCVWSLSHSLWPSDWGLRQLASFSFLFPLRHYLSHSNSSGSVFWSLPPLTWSRIRVYIYMCVCIYMVYIYIYVCMYMVYIYIYIPHLLYPFIYW